METLDDNGNPVDANGDPLGSNYDDRYYSDNDEIKAYHEGINYGQPYEDIPGMDIADYDTDGYDSGLATIPSCPTELREVEYFPHASSDNGGYSMPRDGTPSSTWNKKLTRHVYENQTFTNARLPNNYNALFRNCTFEEVLYIDCSKTGSSYYNNVRFENCTYNGAIVGGIVDIRGNAQIYGTIISMCDTTQWPSGYVTNIGATLDDGGSETTELGDIGVIGITPDKDQMLPSGITSPIIIKPLKDTYSEGA